MNTLTEKQREMLSEISNDDLMKIAHLNLVARVELKARAKDAKDALSSMAFRRVLGAKKAQVMFDEMNRVSDFIGKLFMIGKTPRAFEADFNDLIAGE